MSDESIRPDEVSKFEIELQCNKVNTLVSEYYNLRYSLYFFRQLRSKLMDRDLSEVNRIETGQPSNILIDNKNEHDFRFLTPFEFNEEIKNKLQSVREINKKFFDLLKYATDPSNKKLQLDKASFDFIDGNGKERRVDFLDLVTTVRDSTESLSNNFKELIIEEESGKK